MTTESNVERSDDVFVAAGPVDGEEQIRTGTGDTACTEVRPLVTTSLTLQQSTRQRLKTRHQLDLEPRRPGADDVLVLRQELVHAQTLMDQMTQEREKQQDELRVEFKQLQEKYEL